ncbi:hypothetical protein V5799_005761 [Amblyomma americanum]|uniref:Tnf receptor-associated factor n=1 Tax=Amblyomma americanum TaxID=6943 RepID=A0AAQ4DYC0_AMBAM
MAACAQRWRLRVRGFGKHVDLRSVEFVQKPDYPSVCNWCEVASLDTRALRCRHVVCDRCYEERKEYSGKYRKHVFDCTFDNYATRSEGQKFEPEQKTLADKQVRCLNADSGCHYTGRLGDLDEHLRLSCDVYFKPCSKCGISVPRKGLRSHYIACSGVPGVYVRAADVLSRLSAIGDACRNLEQALALASADSRDALQNAVSLVNEQFARIQNHLATSETPWYVKASACKAPALSLD